MRFVSNNAGGTGLENAGRASVKRPDASHRAADLIPLYDHEQFLFLVERERARADRAAAKPPKAPRRQPPRPAIDANSASAATAAPQKGQPKPSSEGVWGATTDNREFSLVIFRPRSRSDRGGLVELLQCCVRTTDAVGVIDTRRLGVLLPDTAAENAVLFIKKVLALAEEQGVNLSHIVHTYPGAWPDEDSPIWHEPKRRREDDNDEGSPAAPTTPPAPRIARHTVEQGVMRGLVSWLQTAAFRRPLRRAVRA